MANTILKNYVSRSQVRDYLDYILSNGTDLIKEAPDSTYADAPTELRIGATINSIKEFHVGRFLGGETYIKQNSCVMSSDDHIPSMPENTYISGIFYFSKNGRDYTGGPDKFGDTVHQGDIGDVVWIVNEDWNSLELGKTVEGSNHRLFVFWELM